MNSFLANVPKSSVYRDFTVAIWHRSSLEGLFAAVRETYSLVPFAFDSNLWTFHANYDFRIYVITKQLAVTETESAPGGRFFVVFMTAVDVFVRAES